MPPKIKEPVKQLTMAGCKDRGGKDNHRNFRRPRGINITLNEKSGDDAKPHQIRATIRAIELTKNEEI